MCFLWAGLHQGWIGGGDNKKITKAEQWITKWHMDSFVMWNMYE